MSAFQLTRGVFLPVVGFGVYLIPPETTAKVVTTALVQGYRHIDTAQIYRNEVYNIASK